MFRVRDFETFSPKWDVISKSFPPRHKELYKRKCKKILRTRGDGWQQGHSKTDTCINLQRLAACIGPTWFTPGRVPRLRGEVDTNSHL